MAPGTEPDRLTLTRRVGSLDLEVGGGRVEEQQVDLEVQQVGHREVHGLGQVRFDLQQPVHGPVAGVVIDGIEARHRHPLADPLRGRQLGQRFQGPVGHQREQHPFGAGIETAARRQGAQRVADPQSAPQTIEGPHPAQATGVDRGHRPVAAGLGAEQRRVGGTQEPGDARHQAGQSLPVDPVGPPEVVDHLRRRRPRRRVALVVGQLQVGHPGPVLVLPASLPQAHTYNFTPLSHPKQRYQSYSCAYTN